MSKTIPNRIIYIDWTWARARLRPSIAADNGSNSFLVECRTKKTDDCSFINDKYIRIKNIVTFFSCVSDIQKPPIVTATQKNLHQQSVHNSKEVDNNRRNYWKAFKQMRIPHWEHRDHLMQPLACCANKSKHTFNGRQSTATSNNIKLDRHSCVWPRCADWRQYNPPKFKQLRAIVNRTQLQYFPKMKTKSLQAFFSTVWPASCY